MGVVIEAKDLRKSYGNVVALNDVSFSIDDCSVVAMLGPNGAGKSTTINILLGLISQDNGHVSVYGVSSQQAVRKGYVSGMLQTTEGMKLPYGVSVKDVLAYMASLYPNPLPLDQAATLSGLSELITRYTHELSGGETQRVRFALSIVGNPKLLFLDEPTVGMDVDSRRRFWQTVRDFASRGKTVLFATHIMEEVENVADSVIVLHHGQVVGEGTPSQIKSSITGKVLRFRLPQEDLCILDSLPAVIHKQISNEQVVLHSSNADLTVRALCQSGAAFYDLEINAPSLEDAFLELTRQVSDNIRIVNR